MRELADAVRIQRFMRALGREADQEGNAYFTGGATAVLIGWRSSTVDVDISFNPERDRVFRALPGIKNELEINVELVSPADFIPVPAGWEERSTFIGSEGKLSFHHFDFYAQALAKVERAHRQDLQDVRALVERTLVVPKQALRYYEQIERELYRYPAIDPPAFRRKVLETFGS
jgi:hypothetical protein